MVVDGGGGDGDDEEGEMREASGRAKEEEYEGLDDVNRTVEGVTRYVARDDDGCVGGDADDEDGGEMGEASGRVKRRRV